MNIAGIVLDSVVDGPGIRMTVFFQGCPHHCKGCHNPETWDYNKKCNNMSVDDILKYLDSDSILSGVTLSGGEPFSECNLKEIEVLLKEIKKRNKNIWVYTGYVFEDLIKKYPEIKNTILPNVDVIVDGPFKIEKRNLLLDFCGSENQRLVDVKKTLVNNEIVLYTKD